LAFILGGKAIWEGLSRALFPEIQAFFESEEGQREFAEWKVISLCAAMCDPQDSIERTSVIFCGLPLFSVVSGGMIAFTRFHCSVVNSYFSMWLSL